MPFFKEHLVFIALLALAQGSTLKGNKYKRAVEPYSYPVPSVNFNEAPGKSKVVVETIKSISPSQFASGFSTSSDTNLQGTTIPAGSVTYNAFEPDTKQPTSTTFGGYKYPGGASSETSTDSSTPFRTPSIDTPTTLFPGYQQSSAGFSDSDGGNKAGSSGFGGYPAGKPTKFDQKSPDSKPEETGYQYNAGQGFNTPNKIGGSGAQGGGGGGMMGASYMRASSPYYNFHVMLD